MKKFISILLTTSMLAGSAAMPFAAIAAETATTASQASEAAKTGTLTVTVYNEDEGGLYTDEHTSFMICGSPDQPAVPGMAGATFLCDVTPSESNPFVMNDIYISDNFKYTIVDSGSPDYDGFNYRIDYDRSDRTFKFTENPNQDISIYMKKNYFVDNSDKSVTVATHGQDIFDNIGVVCGQAVKLINSDDFKALSTADRISKAKELMKSLSDEELIADYAFDAENNVMNFTYKHGTITGQLRPAVFEDEHKQLDQNETTENKKEISYKIVKLPDKVEYKLGESISLKGIQVEVKKGNEEPVIYTYPDVAFDYQSDIPKAPTVTLSGDYKRDKVGTVAIKVIGSDDVLFNVEFVDDSAVKENSVMLTTESGDDGCSIHLDLKSGTFSMSGSIYQNFAVFGKFERKGNDLYLYAENGSTNVYVLHREDDHFISQSDESGIRLTKGLVFSAENDTFWEKLTSTNESTVKGDANCDGQVDLSDAVMIMQALANPNKYGLDGTAEHHLTEQGKLNGDMNGDGLTSGDALAIQRKLLGLDNDENTDNDVTPSEPTTIGFSNYEEYKKYIEENNLADKIVTYDKLSQYGEFVQFTINSHWMYDNTFSLFYIFNDGSGKNYDLIINDRPQQLEDLVAYPKLTDDLINKSDMRTANTDADAYYEFDNKYYIYTNGKLSEIKWFDDKHIYILIGNPMLYDYPKVDNTYMSKLLDISSTTSTDNSVIAGKIFAYEKEGAGGYCTLSFNENGRFLYSPGKLSSYMGGGDWKIDGDTVSLIGMVDKTIYLKITDDTLVYIAESSDEFPYMDIKDGEKFAIYRPEISSDKFQLNSRYSEYGLGNPKVELNLIASELPEFCYVENVRLYDEDDNFIGMMSPAMDADIWSYLVDCNITEECSKTYYTLTKIRCGQKTYLDDVRSEITVNFKVTPAP